MAKPLLERQRQGPCPLNAIGPSAFIYGLRRSSASHRNLVGVFPDRTALIRLVGAVLAEQNDEWTEARRHLGLDLLAKAGLHPSESQTDETALPTELTA